MAEWPLAQVRGWDRPTLVLTFGTTGDQELLLVDGPYGTRIHVACFVRVRRRWLGLPSDRTGVPLLVGRGHPLHAEGVNLSPA